MKKKKKKTVKVNKRKTKNKMKMMRRLTMRTLMVMIMTLSFVNIIADVDAELHILAEELSSSQARLVLAKRFADDLLLTLDAVFEEEIKQNLVLYLLSDTVRGRSAMASL